MKIQGRIEDKEVVSKDDWTRAVFTIDGKKYSTFDKKIIADFNKGDIVEMETKIVEKDGKQYNNMVSMKKIEEKVGEPEKVAENTLKGTSGSKHTTMYVSYAKDIFCETCRQDWKDQKECMEYAIDLVKQAKKAFS